MTKGHGGLDANECGNVFAGVQSSVLQLDSNLATVATITCSGNVNDVKLGPGKKLYVAGAAFVASYSINPSCSDSMSLSVSSTPDSCTASPLGTATVTVSGGAGPYAYLWSPSGQTTQTATGLSAGTHTVTVTDGVVSLCNSLTGSSQSKLVIVSNIPYSATASYDSTICPGSSVQLDASPSGNTYSWSPSTGLSNSAIANPIATPTVTTTYTVTVTTPGGCTATATATITIGALPPAPTLSLSADGDTLFANGSYSSYQWYRNDTILNGETNYYLVIGNDSASFKVVVTGITGCSNHATYSNRELPIELISFDADYNGKTVDIDWSTASEINNDFFTVERTKDGIGFIPIVHLKGAGTSSHILYYRAEDINPLQGVSAYRLRQTDFDGRYQFSKLVPVTIRTGYKLEILAVNKDAGEEVIRYFISAPAGKHFNLEITDRIGRVIVSKSSIEGVGVINFSECPHGIYLFRVFDSTGSSFRKFVY